MAKKPDPEINGKKVNTWNKFHKPIRKSTNGRSKQKRESRQKTK